MKIPVSIDSVSTGLNGPTQVNAVISNKAQAQHRSIEWTRDVSNNIKNFPQPFNRKSLYSSAFLHQNL